MSLLVIVLQHCSVLLRFVLHGVHCRYGLCWQAPAAQAAILGCLSSSLFHRHMISWAGVLVIQIVLNCLIHYGMRYTGLMAAMATPEDCHG